MDTLNIINNVVPDTIFVQQIALEQVSNDFISSSVQLIPTLINIFSLGLLYWQVSKQIKATEKNLMITLQVSKEEKFRNMCILYLAALHKRDPTEISEILDGYFQSAVDQRAEDQLLLNLNTSQTHEKNLQSLIFNRKRGHQDSLKLYKLKVESQIIEILKDRYNDQ